MWMNNSLKVSDFLLFFPVHGRPSFMVAIFKIIAQWGVLRVAGNLLKPCSLSDHVYFLGAFWSRTKKAQVPGINYTKT